jgi:hypothetical protein
MGYSERYAPDDMQDDDVEFAPTDVSQILADMKMRDEWDKMGWGQRPARKTAFYKTPEPKWKWPDS